MRTIELVKVVETCIGAPNQWNAWDADGQYYYLRYRHRQGTMDFHPGPNVDTWQTPPSETSGRLVDFVTKLDGGLDIVEFLHEVNKETIPQGLTVLAAEGVDYTDYQTYMQEQEKAYHPPTPAAPEPGGAPVPLLEGSFALFEPKPGSLLLVWRPRGSDVDRHMPVPAFVMSMAAQAAGGTLPELMERIRTEVKDG